MSLFLLSLSNFLFRVYYTASTTPLHQYNSSTHPEQIYIYILIYIIYIGRAGCGTVSFIFIVIVIIIAVVVVAYVVHAQNPIESGVRTHPISTITSLFVPLGAAVRWWLNRCTIWPRKRNELLTNRRKKRKRMTTNNKGRRRQRSTCNTRRCLCCKKCNPKRSRRRSGICTPSGSGYCRSYWCNL